MEKKFKASLENAVTSTELLSYSTNLSQTLLISFRKISQGQTCSLQWWVSSRPQAGCLWNPRASTTFWLLHCFKWSETKLFCHPPTAKNYTLLIYKLECYLCRKHTKMSMLDGLCGSDQIFQKKKNMLCRKLIFHSQPQNELCNSKTLSITK